MSVLEARKPLIAAHRGVGGGNLHCNTLDAFDAALRQGADLIELDVAISRDAKLFVFHPGMEFAHLGSDRLIADMTADEVRTLRFLNQDRTPTHREVATLDDALEHLKGRCYINVDKFWSAIGPIAECIRRHGMQEQVVVKTQASEENLAEVERLAPDLPYMLVMRDRDDYTDAVIHRPLRYVGAEVLFARDDAPVAQPEYIRRMHDLGLLLWVNAILYDDHKPLVGGHDDDLSVVSDPDAGWGWLLDRGYDIIQTDWPLALKEYRRTRGLLVP